MVEFLDKDLNADHWDMGRIKVLFRALKVATPPEIKGYIKSNFAALVPFAKELCLLMEAVVAEEPNCFDDLDHDLVTAILTPPASSVQVVRTWLLEIFVRGVIKMPKPYLKDLDKLPSASDRRQVLLLRGRYDDKNYFRKVKTALEQFSPYEQPALILGASCLPEDEYEKWIATLKPYFKRPTGFLFLKWAVENRPSLIEKLSAQTAEHPE